MQMMLTLCVDVCGVGAATVMPRSSQFRHCIAGQTANDGRRRISTIYLHCCLAAGTRIAAQRVGGVQTDMPLRERPTFIATTEREGY